LHPEEFFTLLTLLLVTPEQDIQWVRAVGISEMPIKVMAKFNTPSWTQGIEWILTSMCHPWV
jgi:hypothetical protein